METTDNRDKLPGSESILPESPLLPDTPEVIARSNHSRFWREARIVVSGFTVLCLGVLALWYVWDPEWFENQDDLVYDLGLIGGLMMLFQFIYAMRKRINALRILGNLRVWFFVHMIVGIVSPLIIIVHSRFAIESVNGGVAFFAMLLVVFSGVVGRYLYAQINFNFSGGRKELQDLHGVLHRSVLAPNPQLAPYIEKELKGFMLKAFARHKGYLAALTSSMTTGLRAGWIYMQLSNLGATPGGEAVNRLTAPEKRVLRVYIDTIARLARYNAFKQLFSLWRIAHVPVIYLLLLTGLVHVLAVHMY